MQSDWNWRAISERAPLQGFRPIGKKGMFDGIMSLLIKNYQRTAEFLIDLIERENLRGN